MSNIFRIVRLQWSALWLLACLVCAGTGPAVAAESEINTAAALRAKYAELSPQLGNNQFKRPLHVISVESPRTLKADIYALVDFPFATVSDALVNPAHWCDVLILHLNTKSCRAPTSAATTVLVVHIGKKNFQQLGDAYRVDFAHRVLATTPEYFDVRLSAPTGPLGTSDYRIQLEATSLAEGKTFLHLTYSYGYGFAGRLAMQGYLATIGSAKVGFTRVGTPSGDAPGYIGGVRGVVERNTMRYYLAIDAYLGALTAPPAEQVEKRLRRWFDSTELYPRQLQEIDRAAYLDMKHKEYLRMRTAP